MQTRAVDLDPGNTRKDPTSKPNREPFNKQAEHNRINSFILIIEVQAWQLGSLLFFLFQALNDVKHICKCRRRVRAFEIEAVVHNEVWNSNYA